MPPQRSTPRLADLPVAAKIALTAFLALVGTGYLIAVFNIYEHHRDADLEPGLSLDDLRRVYHGIDKTITKETRKTVASPMLKQVRPGGKMRKYLERGEESAVRSLLAWLEAGAPESGFAVTDVPQPGDPSPKDVLAEQCVRCHNVADGEKPDAPYAADGLSDPDYALVKVFAAPPLAPATQETRVLRLAPMSREQLVQVTHAHILSIPVFTLIVGGLFLLTNVPRALKAVIGPLPMIALCFDFASWWLARPYEPFVYVIAAASGVFAVTYGLQILCILASLWRPRQ